MADGAEAGVEPSFVLAQMRVFLATQGDDGGHSRGPDDVERIDAGERIYELLPTPIQLSLCIGTISSRCCSTLGGLAGARTALPAADGAVHWITRQSMRGQ